MTTMASFNSLPQEVLSRIESFLDFKADRAFSQINKKTREEWIRSRSGRYAATFGRAIRIGYVAPALLPRSDEDPGVRTVAQMFGSGLSLFEHGRNDRGVGVRNLLERTRGLC